MAKAGEKSKLDPVVIAADIANFNGNLAAVAKKHSVDRSTISKFVSKSAALTAVFSDAREVMLDHAESALYRAVLAGESWAVCFFLKTQGKSRGYVERDPELPPLEILLAALPPKVQEIVKRALAAAVQSGGTRKPRGGVTPAVAGDAKPESI